MDHVYELSRSGDVKLLRVRSLLNELTNREILELAQTCLDEGYGDFIVDLEEMPYTNSVGLNFLISLRVRCLDGAGRLIVANASDKILQLLDITKLRPLFQLTDSVDDALRLLNER